MDEQIHYSLDDIRESFKILYRLKDSLRVLDVKQLENIKEFHKDRIQLNLTALIKCVEELQ